MKLKCLQSPSHPRYKFIRKLGEGGSGTVYLVEDKLRPGQPLALKICHSNAPPKDLLREFRALRELRHPRIAPSHDFGILPSDGKPYFTMDFVPGEDLVTALKRYREDASYDEVPFVISLIEQLCDVLGYLHNRELLHLDLKPTNLVVSADGVTLIDFGLLRKSDSDQIEDHLGTALFCAPEMFKKENVDHRADLYSLGATLYRALTGSYPIPGKTTHEVIHNHQQGLTPSSDGLPAELAPIILKLLAKSREHRYNSVEELRAQLPQQNNNSAQTYISLPDLDFQGRRLEFELFFRWLEDIHSQKKNKPLLISGPPGIGKTRFTQACITELIAKGITVISSAPTTDKTHSGWRAIIRSVASLLKINADTPHRFRFLFTSLGLLKDPIHQKEIQRLGVGEEFSRSYNELYQLLKELHDQPVILILEDLDRLSPLDIFITQKIVRDSSNLTHGRLPSLMITLREFKSFDDSQIQSDCQCIELSPLTEEDQTLSLKPFLPRMDTIEFKPFLPIAGGNPGILTHLIHERVVTGKNRSTTAPPKNYLEVLKRRFELLNEEEKSIALYLLFFPKPILEPALSHLVQMDSQRLRASLQSLIQYGFVKHRQGGYFLDRDRFSQLDPYELGLPKDKIERAYRRVGRLLLESPETRTEAVLLLLKGNDLETALPLTKEAGEILFNSAQMDSAVELFELALDHFKGQEVEQLFLERLGDLKVRSGEFLESINCFDRLLKLSLYPEDRMRILRKRGGANLRSGLSDKALLDFQEGMQLSESTSTTDETILLVTEIASLYLYLASFAEASNYANRGLELLASRQSEDSDPISHALHSMNLESITGHIYLRQFDFERAAHHYERSLDYTKHVDSPSSTALILNNLGIAYHQSNQLDLAISVYQRSSKLAETIGDETTLFSIRCNLSSIHARLGEFKESDKLLCSLSKMPHIEKSKRGELFYLYSQALNYRITLQDSTLIWKDCINLAKEIPDPLIEKFGKVYLLENEIYLGRWAEGRTLATELLNLKTEDPRLERAIFSRVAYLEALVGNNGLALNLTQKIFEPFRKNFDKRGSPSHGDLWEWVIAASALMETGEYEEAGLWISRALEVFQMSKQLPGVLECLLLLGEISIRRGNLEASNRYLNELNTFLNEHALLNPIRQAGPRLPFLAARLDCIQQKHSSHSIDVFKSETKDLLVDSRGAITPGSNWEITWLIELIRMKFTSSGSEASLKQHKEDFLKGLDQKDRKTYLSRDHLKRLGLVQKYSEVDSNEEVLRIHKFLKSLEMLRSCPEPQTSLKLVVEITDSLRGTIFHKGSEIMAQVSREISSSSEETNEGESKDTLHLDLYTDPDNGPVWLELVKKSPQLEFSEHLPFIARILSDSLLDLPAEELRTTTQPFLRDGSPSTIPLTNPLAAKTNSPQIQDIYRILQQTRDSTLPVLLTGESGVGKDYLARWIHIMSPRSQAQFVVINVAAIPENLFEAELFGYEKGAFTGADEKKEGTLLAAQNGTVYLDNVDSISMPVQVKLLRLIEEKCIRPVGSHEEIPLDIRFIASTQTQLRRLCDSNSYREDLFFRLKGITIDIPPLRERAEDIPILVSQFQADLPDQGRDAVFMESAWEVLRSHSWPGNIRELESLVRRLSLTIVGPIGSEAILTALGKVRSTSQFPRWLFKDQSYSELLETMNREYLLYIYEKHAGDVDRITEELNISKRGVYKKFAQAGLKLATLKKKRRDEK